MKLNSQCSEPGCLNGGHFHPVNQYPLHGAWVSPKLYCMKHRKGKGSSFVDEATAVRRFGKGWRLRATETPPGMKDHPPGVSRPQ